MVLHDSGYHCGEYYRSGDVGGEHFILQRNYDEAECEWTEPSHSRFALLFYANETDRASEITVALAPIAEVLSVQEL